MKLEAVIVCVNYADFLCWTLPINKQFFDRLVVVTSSRDARTAKLCEYWNVQCIVSNACYEDKAEFNKGKMINVGLAALDGDGWIAHMDADILLPPLFRSTLERLALDDYGVYHMDRMMCRNFTEWLQFYIQPVLSNENHIFVHLKPFEIGVRIANHIDGWIPIGYFQMWNQGRKKIQYPVQHTDAGRSDMLFANLFSRDHKHMLAELICIHLETLLMENDKTMGRNWNGRRTPLFGADVIDIKKDETVSSTLATAVPLSRGNAKTLVKF